MSHTIPPDHIIIVKEGKVYLCNPQHDPRFCTGSIEVDDPGPFCPRCLFRKMLDGLMLLGPVMTHFAKVKPVESKEGETNG